MAMSVEDLVKVDTCTGICACEVSSWRLVTALALSAALHASVMAANYGARTSSQTGGGLKIEATLLPSHARAEAKVALDASAELPIGQSADTQAAPPDSLMEKGEATRDFLSPSLIKYFGPRELTKRPRPLSNLDLESPKLNGWRSPGRALFLLLIDSQGNVDAILNGESNLPDGYRDEIRGRLANTGFQPGEIDGVPVDSRMTIEVEFHPDVSASSGEQKAQRQ